MLKTITSSILACIALLTIQSTFAFEKIFYVTRYDTNLQNIIQHHNSIDLLIAQGYRLQDNGKIKDGINASIIQTAKQFHIKLMPYLTNFGFDLRKTDVFLHNEKAKQNAIQALIAICQQNNFYGIQIDFEHISINDRKLFTDFYRRLAQALHKYNFKISVAIVPQLFAIPPTIYYAAVYKHWAGCYDQTQLGTNSDFVVLMAYDQHIDNTTPGPVAGYPWVKQAITFTLKNIPNNKLVLGIPAYSTHWGLKMQNINGSRTAAAISTQISYPTAMEIMKNNHIKLQWQNNDKVHYSMYNHFLMNEYLFLEDKESFKYKLKLRKAFNLHGIAVFRLGIEDPKLWDVLS